MGNNILKNITCLLFAVIMIAALSACGSGGGGSDAPSAQSVIVSGVAATGAPVSGNVYLRDSSSPPVEVSTAINSDGSYSFNVTGFTAPYYLYAEELDAGGQPTGQFIYSVAMTPGIANINPATHIIVATAAGADPAEVYSGVASLDQNGLDKAVNDFQNMLSTLLSNYGVPGINPLKDIFSADQTGLDAVFDNVDMGIDFATGVVTFTSKTDTPIVIKASGVGYVQLLARAELLIDIDDSSLPASYLTYSYGTKIFESTSITEVEATVGTVIIKGTGTVDGISGYTFTATVTEGTVDEIGMEIKDTTGTVHQSSITSTPINGGKGFTVSIE